MGQSLRSRAGALLLALGLAFGSTGCTGGGFGERSWTPRPDSPGNEMVAKRAAPGRAAVTTVAQTPAPRGVDSIGVMTFNMKHKNRPQELAAIGKSIRTDLSRTPEIILCQEVVFGRDGADDNTAHLLAKELGYYSKGTKRTSDSEGVGIVSKYPFAYYAERHLDAQTSPLLIGFRRVSVMGEFMVPGVGRVRAVNVHYTNWGFETRIRRKQIEETLAWIARREKEAPAAVTFFGGDFNAERDWEEMAWLDRAGGNYGLTFKDHNSDTPSFGPPGRPRARIDFVFVAAKQNNLSLAEERVMWKDGLHEADGDHFHPSDHLAVVHRYAVKPPAIAVSSAAE